MDDEESKKDLLSFKPEDERLIEELHHLIWKVLRRSPLGPREVHSIGQLLHAVERLPWSTPAVFLTFTISEHFGGEGTYCDLFICDSELVLGMGASFYDPGVGSDHESEHVLEVDINGNRYASNEDEWIERFKTLLNGRHSIKIENESDDQDIDWSDDDYRTDWKVALKNSTNEDEDIYGLDDEPSDGVETNTYDFTVIEDIISSSSSDSDLFDNAIYELAKPYFDTALKHFADNDIRAAMRQLLHVLIEDRGMTRESAQKMRPYVIHYINEWQSPGAVSSQSDKDDLNYNPKETED